MEDGFWKGFVLGIVIVALIWGIGAKGKYEGYTAEELFNLWDDCDANLIEYQACVESTIENIGDYCTPNY